jgi:hypothetical protein
MQSKAVKGVIRQAPCSNQRISNTALGQMKSFTKLAHMLISGKFEMGHQPGQLYHLNTSSRLLMVQERFL